MEVIINQLEISRRPFEETDSKMEIWCRLYLQCGCSKIFRITEGIPDATQINSDKDIKNSFYKTQAKLARLKVAIQICPACNKTLDIKKELDSFWDDMVIVWRGMVNES